MKLRDRNGYYWVEAKYLNPETGKRERLQRSTGVLVDGTKSAERTAQLMGEQIVRAAILTGGKPKTAVTVADAFVANRAAKRLANRSEATFQIVKEKQARIEAYFRADRDLRTIDADALAQYATAARESGRASATVLRELRELAMGMRALGVPVPAMPDLGRIAKPRERWLPLHETRRLLAHLPASRREHVLAHRLLGTRKSELDKLAAGDLMPADSDDAVPGYMRVRGTKVEGADRVLPVHPELWPILTRRAASRPYQLFEPWNRGNSDRDLRKASNEAGLGDISFNDLRRSFAMDLLRAGTPTREVAELLGHTSTRMVEAHYARLRPGKHLAAAIARLTGGYGEAPSRED